MSFRQLVFLVLPALPSVAAAASWTVHPDGSGDAPTIATALAIAAPGDTVVVGPGLYEEHDVALASGVCLFGLTGDPEDVVIDAAGLGRAAIGDGLDETTLVTGITFANGVRIGSCLDDPGTGTYCMGGGLLLTGSSPRIERCNFRNNFTSDNGGGVASLFSSPTFTECVFAGNESHVGAGFIAAFPPGQATFERCLFTGNLAEADGGGLYGFDALVTLENCTLTENSAGESGSGIFWQGSGTLIAERCLVTFGNGSAIGVGFASTTPSLSCCDVFGNGGGDWTGPVAPMATLDGNLSADPVFCDPSGGLYTLRLGSPCAAPDGCGAVGAEEVGCGPVSVASSTWSSIKARYR